MVKACLICVIGDVCSDIFVNLLYLLPHTRTLFSFVHPVILLQLTFGSGAPEDDEQISAFVSTEGGKTTVASLSPVAQSQNFLLLLVVLQDDDRDTDSSYDSYYRGSLTTGIPLTNLSSSSGMAAMSPVCLYAASTSYA